MLTTDAQEHRSVGAREHRPQALLLSFLGSMVLDRGTQRLASSIFLNLMDDLGVGEQAARATLSRMSRRGLLDRHRQGRTATYSLTEFGAGLLSRGRDRVETDTPFDHPEDEWTLLSYSMPESQRDLRHRVRAALTWAGFGGLRDGLWIAPGSIDLNRVFTEAGLDGAADLADWFAARPLPGTDIAAVIRRAWDIDSIAEEHRYFLARWGRPGPDLDAMATLTLLGADWLRVLRVDPGLPAAHLPADWPGPASAALYRRTFLEWEPRARLALDSLLGQG